ncbi:MAG: DNA gyrase C-terminal beta-propeller domain-containing protein, partial [Candidatus Paceibacterota bacterium]
TKLKEYKIQKRGGSGIKTMSVTKKTGQLVAVHINDGTEEEVFAISKMGQVIRTKIAEISVLGRATQGVRVMKLREGDSLASLTCL